jgi:ribosomal protein S27AE
MNSYFFKVSEEETKSILSKHRTPYEGYVRRGFEKMDDTIFVEDLAKDKSGITIKGSDKFCPDCGGTLKEEVCEQCGYTDINPKEKGDYSEEIVGESIVKFMKRMNIL